MTQLRDTILEYFPGATDIEGDEFYTTWNVGQREYAITAWAVYANEGPKDFSTHGVTIGQTLSKAAREDWDDSGTMLNISESMSWEDITTNVRKDLFNIVDKIVRPDLEDRNEVVAHYVDQLMTEFEEGKRQRHGK